MVLKRSKKIITGSTKMIRDLTVRLRAKSALLKEIGSSESTRAISAISATRITGIFLSI